MRHTTNSVFTLAAVALVTAIAVAACGGSSKPGYCTDRTNLNNSIRALTNLNPSGGISGLQSQLQKIESDATALVNSARNDFPNETSAITSSIDRLRSSVQGVGSTPSASQIATIVSDASSVVSSVRKFSDAASSKCG